MIDFVVTWVDGSDPEWQAERAKYSPKKSQANTVDNRDNRYRDWDNLQYWFRAVEKFAPWVNKVFFVTNGQKPTWLNTECKRLVWVKHSDYIPAEYLPTFSSRVIENNLFRISELSETFVLFNDDMFFLSLCEPEIFFRNGLPCHPAALMPVAPDGKGDLLMTYTAVNMVHIINRNFDIRKTFSQNAGKWFSFRHNGLKHVISNLFLSRYPVFVGFNNVHLPAPVCKKTMAEVWEKEEKVMVDTSMQRFRGSSGVNHYLFRYWDLASGHFEPTRPDSFGKAFHLNDKNSAMMVPAACDAIGRADCPMVCINDSFVDYEQFESAKAAVNAAFDRLLPDKSSFEL